jgi:glycosyltransferase involved in cell wall biosynthesis
MNVEIGTDVLAADSAEAFSKAVLSLLESEKLAEKLKESGKSYVRSNHSLETVYDPLNQALVQGSK